MPRSRSFVLLTVASVLVLVFAAIGWCGGPVTRAPGQDQQPGTPPATTGDAVPGNLTLAPSWVPSSTPNGSNGVSPWVTYSSLGLKQSFSWGFRATYEPQMWGLDLCLNFDINRLKYTGDKNWTEGYPGHPFLVVGQGVRSTFDLSTLVFSADWGVSSYVTGPSSALRIGPRISWTQYIDSLKLENTNTNRSDTRGHGAGMLGFGLVGALDLSKWSGYGYNTSMGSASPMLKAAASIGQGGGMRFWQWEVFLRIFQSANIYTGSSLTAPTLMLELGWVRYNYVQTIFEDELLPGGLGLYRDANTNFTIDYPSIRLSGTF